MKILTSSPKNHKKILTEIIKTLKNGGVVALPTDTVFGLVALAHNEKAVEKIFAIKNRPLKKPISIFAPDLEAAKKYTRISPKNKKVLTRLSETGLLEKITFVLPLKNPALKTAAAGGKTIGIRIPKDKFIAEVLKKINEPLAQTSANPSDLPEARSAREVFVYFKDRQLRPDIIIDGKIKLKSPPSTVIDLTKTPPKILREGAVSKKEIKEILNSLFFTK